MRMDEIQWKHWGKSTQIAGPYIHKQYGEVNIFKGSILLGYPDTQYGIFHGTNSMMGFSDIVDFAFHISLCEPMEGSNEDG